MYLLFILLLIIIIPFIVMPTDITRADKSPYFVVLKGIMVTGAASAIVFMTAAMTGDGVYTQLHDIVKEISPSAANDPNVISMLGWEDVDEATRTKNMMTLYDGALKLFPASVILLSTISSYLGYIILSRALNKRSPVKLMPKFREFSLPGNAVMGLVGMYMLVWILSMMGTLTNDAYYLNVNSVFDLAFCLQGMSVIFMLFYIKRIPKGFAAIVSLILWCLAFGKAMLVLMGMMDLVIGLKTRMFERSQKR